MDNQHYHNFKLTEDNCDVEPIHKPIAVHSHGYLMAFDDRDPNRLAYFDDGLSNLLNVEEERLRTLAPDHWMQGKLFEAYNEMKEPYLWDSVDPIPVSINNTRLNIIRHIHKGYRFIELEPAEGDLQHELSSFRAIKLVTGAIKPVNDLKKLFKVFTEIYRKVIGYDRIMVYRFDHDHHGIVEGESRAEDLESFLGLHYPATDIPKMARDLFILNRSRIIPDVTNPTKWLRFTSGDPQVMDELDLSLSQIRATSPIHVEYLKNMGVSATFTLALVVEDKLWGLIACHHYQPRFLNYETRKTGELIADVLCRKIAEISNNLLKQKRRLNLQKENLLRKNISHSTDILLQLMDNKIDLSNLLGTDGYALVTASLGLHKTGLAPSDEALLKINSWLDSNSYFLTKGLYHTRDIRSDCPEELDLDEKIGGLIAISLENLGQLKIIWFNKTLQSISHWGGDPSRPYEVDHQNDGNVRLSPRKSFEKWKVTVDTQSPPWTQENEELALSIRNVLLNKSTEWNVFKSQELKTEFEQLTYVASHDLQEPLRTVTNYLTLLKEELEQSENENLIKFISRASLAANRMKSLITEILIYSNAGMEKSIDWFSMEEVLHEVIEDLEGHIEEEKAVITYENLPVVRGNFFEIKQLFQNLISNALKYRKKDINPTIHIQGQQVSTHWIFSIRDNGIGIEKKYLERIFLLFQRLHHKHQYEGTGMGLALCRKIVENMGGTMWATSEPGKGSTFWFSLHKSKFKTSLNQ